MVKLGLVPQDMVYEAEYNVLPGELNPKHVQYQSNTASEHWVKPEWVNDTATLYPCEQTLLNYIHIEESQLLRRERMISEGHKDPGRPSWKESYGHLPALSVFTGYEIGKPPLECGELFSLNVNIVVRMKTTVLAKILSLTAKDMLSRRAASRVRF